MVAARRWTRATIVVLIGAGTAVWYACTDRAPDSLTGPSASAQHTRRPPPDLRGAIAAQRRHTDALLRIPGVLGTAITVLPDGRAGMQVLLEREGIANVPLALDGIPVSQRVTGRLMAFSDPTKRQRPAPLGFSVGHPAITAGTIGARVRDATGRLYILSNNHVLANSNGANIGDPQYQPGPYDGGTAADQIATLADFQTITFGSTGNNLIDAAIALSGTDVLSNATPSDDGYSMPNANIYGDADGDGLIDDRGALLGLNVQKYGRTTRLTHGRITGVNATLTICYQVSGFSCVKSARFVDQLIIEPGTFSGGGDSGSLIVTDDENVNPVALLFAGSSTVTIANRIDLVLNRFGVSIDGFAPPPPGPLTDVAVISVGAPGPVVQGSTSGVTVTVKNFGNQEVSAFDVTLQDATENVTVGTQSVAGLAVGASATVSFAWTPSATGEHSLVGSHTLADDKPGNDQSSATVAVNAPLTDVGVTAVSAPGGVSQGKTINVVVTVGNVGNQVVGTSFVVTLEDATDGETLGSQTVTGLAVGANATLTFSWNTTSATLGSHTLVATHSLADGNAANNQRSAVVGVNPKLMDVALTSITGPASVTQGETAHIGVTVQNVGEQDVSASFDVVLTDGFGGPTIGTQTVAGLALGASATLDFPWNTAGATITGHTLFARQMLADDSSGNNSRAIGITVKAPVTVVTDVAVTGVSAPAAVSQGQSVNVAVTVGNVGNQDVGSGFVVTLQDATDNVTLGSQTVTGLAVGANATLTFSWNTTSATLGGHTLVATHSLADADAANNQRSAAVTVNPMLVDIALTSLTGPASVTQGTAATIGVTVQNVGQQDVGDSFEVVLTDATAGVTIGSQTVTGLTVGSTSTLTFSWNTTSATLGGHTLVATHSLADDNAANNHRSTAVTVNPKPIDIALTSITGPASVTQGETAHIGVTVQNVGEQDVSASFDVVLTDGNDGTTIGRQTVAGLALGTSATLDFPWNTAGVAITGHTLFARQMLADVNSSNNSRAIGITVKAPVTLVTDVAVTGMSAPAAVTQGNTTSIGITVQNVGERDVGAVFDVVLTDATAGVTIGSQAVAGLARSASATLTFGWNTTGAALGGHTLVATHTLTDDVAPNNERSTTVTVNAKLTDVAVASLTGPAAVTQGNTATIGVTVQNVGQQDVGASFDVVLTDATAGVTIGGQTVAGLVVGATSTLSFGWNTTSAALGGHTLVASHKLTDDNAANNQRSASITVNPRVTDIALTSLTGPASVTQGDTAQIGVTVQNVGGQDVGASFDVVLTDGTYGGTIGTQSVAGLAVGASATLAYRWNTAGVPTTGHTLVARQMLADNNSSNNSRAIGITVNPLSVHAGNLTGFAATSGTSWSATVEIAVHDSRHNLLNGVTVSGSWGGPNTGACTTGAAGTCSITYASIPMTTGLVSFAVSGLAVPGYVYKSAANHDPDGSSNGSTIFVRRP